MPKTKKEITEEIKELKSEANETEGIINRIQALEDELARLKDQSVGATPTRVPDPEPAGDTGDIEESEDDGWPL